MIVVNVDINDENADWLRSIEDFPFQPGDPEFDRMLKAMRLTEAEFFALPMGQRYLERKHLPGQHNQADHGRRGSGAGGRYGIPHIPIDQIPKFQYGVQADQWLNEQYPHLSTNLAPINGDIAHEIMGQIVRMANDFPQVMKDINSIGVIEYPEGRRENVWATATPPRSHIHKGETVIEEPGRISLNRHFFADNQDELIKGLKYAEEIKFHPKGADTPASIITHEFGHHVQFYLENRPSNDAFTPYVRASGFGLIRDTSNAWAIEHNKGKRVSEYAKTNERELFAENFTALYHTPKRQQSASTKRLGKLIEHAANPANHLKEGEWKWQDEVPREERSTVADNLAQLRAGILGPAGDKW